MRLGKLRQKNPNWKEVKDPERWVTALKSRCEWCGERSTRPPPWGLQQHHVVYRQAVRAEHGDQYDPRDSLTLCCPCHTRHHRNGDVERHVPLTLLSDDNYEFARELFGGPAAYEYLRRRYAGDDPRLHELLDA